jgi:hypothetical protein
MDLLLEISAGSGAAGALLREVETALVTSILFDIPGAAIVVGTLVGGGAGGACLSMVCSALCGANWTDAELGELAALALGCTGGNGEIPTLGVAEEPSGGGRGEMPT